MLSILRVLPRMRTVAYILLLAVFCAGSSSSFAAAHTRAPKKAATASQSKKTTAKKAPAKKARAQAVPARQGKRSVTQASRKSSRRAAAATPERRTVAKSRRGRRAPVERKVSLTRSHRRTIAVDPAPAPPAPRASRMVSTDAPAPAPIAQAAATGDKVASAEPALQPISPAPANTLAASAAPIGGVPLHAPIVAMAPLRGSMESLIRQNEKTDADNLERILDDDDLNHRIQQGMLVPVPASGGLVVNPSLPQNRRYCRPWTASFLADLSHAHEATFHHSFIVSSAVRTVEYQKRLMRTNGNAAAAEGDIASPHLTGATIDIAKKGMSRQELYWMRNRLDALQDEGKIDVEEEFRQACFHITVYKSYIGAGPLHKHRRATPLPDTTVADGPVVEGQ